jgi:hypothetical protein
MGNIQKENKMNFTVCKKLEDCVCGNCINWVKRKDNIGVCQAQPIPIFPARGTDIEYWCSDGQWLCEYYGPSTALKQEVLFRADFIDRLLINEKDAEYRRMEEEAREKFMAEVKGATTEEQIDSLFCD